MLSAITNARRFVLSKPAVRAAANTAGDRGPSVLIDSSKQKKHLHMIFSDGFSESSKKIVTVNKEVQQGDC